MYFLLPIPSPRRKYEEHIDYHMPFLIASHRWDCWWRSEAKRSVHTQREVRCTVDQLERKFEEDFVEPAPSDTWHLAEGTRVGECHDEQKQSQDRIGLA